MYNFIFAFAFALLLTNQPIQSMERDDEKSHGGADNTDYSYENTFTLSTGSDQFEFRPVDLLNISEENRLHYREACGDFDAVRQMFDFKVATGFKLASLWDSDVGYNAMVKLITKDKENPDFVRLDWFIFDIKESKFAGILSIQNKLKFQLSHSTETKLNLSADQIWELEAGLMKSYRNKKIATDLMPLFINKLKSFPFLQNAWIVFAANKQDVPVHRLACGTTYLGRQNALIDFSEFEYSLKVDVFGFKIEGCK